MYAQRAHTNNKTKQKYSLDSGDEVFEIEQPV